MKKTTFYWRRQFTCGEEFRIEVRQINAAVSATANGFAVDLCETWFPEATSDMGPDEFTAVRLRAIMEAYGQKWQSQSPYFDWEIEVEPTPTHTDPDGEAIASALASLRADM